MDSTEYINSDKNIEPIKDGITPDNQELEDIDLSIYLKDDVECNDYPQDLLEYIDAVNTLADKHSDLMFENSSSTHAAIVISTMLNHSTKEVCIYDTDLSGDISNKYSKFFSAFVRHLDAGKSIRMVIDNPENPDTALISILRKIKQTYPDRIHISRAAPEFKTEVKNAYDRVFNFAIGDEESFRYEQYSSEDHSSGSTRQAICSFNNKAIAHKLKSAFDLGFKYCPSII